MTASRLRPSRPTDKWQHRLSSRTTTGTEPASRQLPKSANRNTVESNNVKNNNKSKEQNLDTGDLLIESRLLGSNPPLGFHLTLPGQRVFQAPNILESCISDSSLVESFGNVSEEQFVPSANEEREKSLADFIHRLSMTRRSPH